MINDKHIETIVRQMLKKVEIKEPGDTDLLTGETLDLIDLNKINNDLVEKNKKPAKFEKSFARNNESFFTNKLIHFSCIISGNNKSAHRCLYKRKKIDTLQGLKENVIVGRLVPAGTGLTKMGWDKEAKKQDLLRLEELKKPQKKQ